ncbi:MAG: prephenate dehydrogenase/arogenate dehydrogenase family protein, partial [Elusimicrobia bacterium]|nr:prephenate dehydrogenase/arogenate dehydrogenase family protein [Elusimicrobiota bacterium]
KIRILNYKISGIGRHIEKLKLAKKLGAVDEFTTDFISGVKDADIVILATTVDTIVPIFKKIAPHLKTGCIVTDAGSIKANIVRGISKILPKSIYFVGAHPLAGSEKTGVRFADPNLYKGSTVVITPLKNTPKTVIEIISAMWKKTGANILQLSPEIHDKLVASTSHLPHILSAALTQLVNNANLKNNSASKLLAGSFKDMTRIADSDSENWAAICFGNMLELNRAIEEYIKILKKVKAELNSPKKLKVFFGKSKKNRWQLLQ